MALMLSALNTGRALLPRIIIFLLLVLIFVRHSVPEGLVRPEGLGILKPMGLQGLIRDDDVRTSQETRLCVHGLLRG
jgi:hypothetical protein